MRGMRLVVLTLLLAWSPAYAQHAAKNPKTAQVLSSVGASISGAVVVAGFVTAPDSRRINEPVMYTGIGMLFITPSLGEMYAGEYVTLGMGVRALSAGLAVWTMRSQTTLVRCDDALTSSEPLCEQFTANAYPLLGLAAIGFIGGVWYDALDADDAVDRWNKRHGLSVTPAVPSANGPAPGLTLSGRF
jgi:hypothetical protein